MTPEPTVENVKPLIESHFMRGQYATFIFVCPETGRKIQSDPTNIVEFQPTERVHGEEELRKKLYALKIDVQQAVRNHLGNNDYSTEVLKALTAVIEKADEADDAPEQDALDLASVAAFERELRNFVWNDEGGFWEHKDAEYYRNQKQ